MKNTTNRSLLSASLSLLFAAAVVPPLCAAQTPAGAAPPAAAQPPAGPAPGPAAPTPPPPAPLSAEEAGYIIGVNFGNQLSTVGITSEASVDAIARGMKDGMGGKTTTPGDQQRLQAYVKASMDAAVAKNKAASAEFLAHNSHEKGVKTTASGLQYKIIKEGDTKAASPQPTDQVTVQYRGTLADGKEFDSSFSRGTPATFPVVGVIKGWQEALVMMKPGAHWQIFVPPELGYDTKPRPGIPGGSALVFDVELLSIKKPPPPPAASATPPGPRAAPPAGGAASASAPAPAPPADSGKPASQ